MRHFAKGFLAIAFLAVIAAGAIIVAASPAAAQAADTSRVLPGLAVEVGIAVFGPIIGGLGVLALGRLYTLAGLKQTEANRATVEQVLHRAVDLARARYGLPGSGLIPANMKQSALRVAADYAVERGPQALSKFGVSDASSVSLHKMLEGRFAGIFSDTAAGQPRSPGPKA